MAFVGDMSFGDFPFCQGYGIRSIIDVQGPNYIFNRIMPNLSSHDITFGNLETVLSLEGEDLNLLHTREMRGSSLVCKELKNVGFNCINIANNHILQHGVKAFENTVKHLESERILVVGVKDINEWHCKPVITNVKGKNIGILGYAFEKDKYYFGDPLYAFGNLSLIKNDITRLRPLVDILVVSCHWGLEFINRPSALTIQNARSMVDYGANVVIGHHPHVLQGLEMYNNGLIAYSLGNFIFDMQWDKCFTESIILEVAFSESNKIQYNIIPVIIDDNRPVLPDPKEKTKIIQKIKILSDKIDSNRGDLEQNNLKYYMEYESLRKRNRIRAYNYFLKNINRYKKRYIFQQIIQTINNRLGDIFKKN